MTSGRRIVVVLGTGGTIAGRAPSAVDNVGYTAGQVDVADLVRVGESPSGVEIVTEQVAQVDSKDMTHAVWLDLARRCAHWLARPGVAGVVVTHGTDTLEETAFFLQTVLSPARPIVLTCAMRPASALAPDGPQNVRDAIVVAACAGATGVSAVCAGTIHAARDVRKVHTYRLDAFSSGDAGPLGYVEEGRVRQVRNWPATLAGSRSAAIEKIVDPGRWPRVELVVSHAGASGASIDSLLAHAGVETTPLRGLVLAATGNGTLHHTLEAAAARAAAAGIAVVRATRCAEGRILATSGDRVRSAGDLSPTKARIALMLELMDVAPFGA